MAQKYSIKDLSRHSSNGGRIGFRAHYDLTVLSGKGEKLNYDLFTTLHIKNMGQNGRGPKLSVLDMCDMTPRKFVDRQGGVVEDPSRDFRLEGLDPLSRSYGDKVRKWLKGFIRGYCGEPEVLNIH